MTNGVTIKNGNYYYEEKNPFMSKAHVAEKFNVPVDKVNELPQTRYDIGAFPPRTFQIKLDETLKKDLKE